MQVPATGRSRPSYGWVIVAVSFILLIGAFGTQMCFGLFLTPLTEEFGWSRAAVSGAMSLLMAVSGLVGVFMGKATDRWGARAAVAPGIVLGAIGYLLTSRIDHLWEFYLYVRRGRRLPGRLQLHAGYHHRVELVQSPAAHHGDRRGSSGGHRRADGAVAVRLSDHRGERLADRLVGLGHRGVRVRPAGSRSGQGEAARG